jgi:RNA polymerase sigma factor (sigma-70 family)
MTGDQVADFERLVRPLESQMLGTIWKILRNPEDVADAHQQVLLRIWRRWDKVRTHPNPPALVLRICTQEAYDLLRKRVRNGWREDLATHEPTLQDPKPIPRETVEGREIRAEILKAIAKLPKKQGLAVLMRIVQEQSYSEIAAALGCSEISARTQVARGRNRLAERLSRFIQIPGEGKRS